MDGWHETPTGLIYVVSGHVQFDDDHHHWTHGFCRLLELTDADARRLVETIVDRSRINGRLLNQLDPAERVAPLKEGISTFYSQSLRARPQVDLEAFAATSNAAFDGSALDHIWSKTISGDNSRLILGSKPLQYGWLVDAATRELVIADSITYDQDYFENPQHAHFGMKHYTSDESWRMDKARRMLRQVLKHSDADPAQSTLLDIGSATGYFRKAAEEIGMQHFGIDISEPAIEACKKRFGFTTYAGKVADLQRLAPELLGKCDLITLWDVIEHVDDPAHILKVLAPFLAEHGHIAMRTPNLVALEADLLQDMYYSFKFDHIRYFSPHAMKKLIALCGLKLAHMDTASHIFKGFLGGDFLFQQDQELKGADMFAICTR